ncbi:MAG: hypothetical protein MUC77_03435 [Chromatiaceae bacterium]|jgi:hypothetical protein|nr:hypothetical protein [Chromatiaceae bacterium]
MAVRLLVLGCKTMREGVTVSAVFLVGAILLLLAAEHVVPDVLHIRHIVLFFALVLIILAPIVLISTFLLSVIPGAREKLDKCEH